MDCDWNTHSVDFSCRFGGTFRNSGIDKDTEKDVYGDYRQNGTVEIAVVSRHSENS